jgi:UDP:flavonoid glycosyltransferase YjiC (YdhE family)
VKDFESRPKVGFLPNFWSLGETIPSIKIANEYLNLGGDVVFFSHGGNYEYLVKDIGCKVVKLSGIWRGYLKKAEEMINAGESSEKIFVNIYRPEFIRKAVKEEIEEFNKNEIKLVLSNYILTSSISARALKIPLIVVLSGTSIPPYYSSNSCTFPEKNENVFTKIIPKFIKNKFFRWYVINCKYLVKEFNKVAKEYNIKSFRSINDIQLGDYTFVCDDIKFLGLAPSKEFPKENFIGPIYHWNLFKDQQGKIDTIIKNHLNKPGKSIFLSMGSSGDERLFLKIIKILNKTDFNVIVAYSKILEKNQLPEINENILLTEYVPSVEKVMKLVDLSIIHGGRGTVYTAAYAGKPVIGFFNHIEQQYNIDNLVRHGTAIRLSKKNFNENILLNAVDNIFSNYSVYFDNAKNLASKLTHENSEKKAAQRLIEISQSYYRK